MFHFALLLAILAAVSGFSLTAPMRSFGRSLMMQDSGMKTRSQGESDNMHLSWGVLGHFMAKCPKSGFLIILFSHNLTFICVSCRTFR